MSMENPLNLQNLSTELPDSPDLPNPYDWSAHARPSQRIPPGDWCTWLIMAGRGFGKTRTGAETIRQWVKEKTCRRIALIGDTELQVQEIMIHGHSGLLNVHPPQERPTYTVRNQKVTWPCGAMAHVYTAHAYEGLRGPQFDGAWIDELAKFEHPQQVWDQLMFGLRLGQSPKVIVTTTPRPLPILERLQKDSTTVVTKGTTYENARNLSPSFVQQILKRYEGTRLGAQEIMGEVLYDQIGTLWKPSYIQYGREEEIDQNYNRIVIGVDPAVTCHQDSDETGIIVAAMGKTGKAYVLDDLSGRYDPSQWSKIVQEAYHHYGADRVVAEVNQGGDMVEHTLRVVAPTISYKGVRATRGKYLRAEPVAALYEQGKILHTRCFPELERQMIQYTPMATKSPDRVDALVWAMTELCLNSRQGLPRMWTV